MTVLDRLQSFAQRRESESLLRRNAYFAAIVYAAQLHGCADAARESSSADSAADIGTHYVVTGRGEPVVLVHGFSQTHAAWVATPVYEDLVRDHKVIAVDLRGHGDSDKPYDPMAYGPNMQSDLVELLDHLDIDRAHFVGFSLGANIVGDLVVSSPERVQTATMGSGYFTTWDEGEEIFAQMTEDRAATDERYPWEPENQDYRALAAVIRGARNSVVGPGQIASINTPTLMVFGSIEVENMSERQRARLENVPDSITVLIIEGADHDSSKAAILHPEFTRAVRNLIASNPIQSADR